jgi:hypothetical protein
MVWEEVVTTAYLDRVGDLKMATRKIACRYHERRMRPGQEPNYGFRGRIKYNYTSMS